MESCASEQAENEEPYDAGATNALDAHFVAVYERAPPAFGRGRVTLLSLEIWTGASET